VEIPGVTVRRLECDMVRFGLGVLQRHLAAIRRKRAAIRLPRAVSWLGRTVTWLTGTVSCLPRTALCVRRAVSRLDWPALRRWCTGVRLELPSSCCRGIVGWLGATVDRSACAAHQACWPAIRVDHTVDRTDCTAESFHTTVVRLGGTVSWRDRAGDWRVRVSIRRESLYLCAELRATRRIAHT